MIFDRTGNELKEGDVVLVKMTIHNIISDSERINVLLGHTEKQPGQPEDFRLAVSSDTVMLFDRRKIERDPERAPEPVIPEAASQPEQTTEPEQPASA
jgi:hypothetical protein